MIRRIELHNFASHNDTELDFGNGKNVIIGMTGSGKTNILQALDFAFLGEVPDANLPELIADSSDTTEVVLDYEDPRTGQTYRIHRTLKRVLGEKVEHECSLTNLATGEVTKRPDPVRKTLETFGIDPSVWRYVIHVAQGRFADLLEETQERKASLDKLFQVSQLESTHLELGRREAPITQIELRKQKNKEKKTSLERDARKQEEEETNLRRMQEQRKKKQDECDKLKKERDRVEGLSEKTEKALNEFKIAEDAIQQAKIASQNALRQIKGLIGHLEGLLAPSACDELRELPSKEIANRIRTLEDDLTGTRKEEHKFETAFRESTQKAGGTQSKVQRAKDDQELIQQELGDIDDYLSGKAKQPKIACDRCGSILTRAQWKKHLQERRMALKELQTLANKCAEQLKSDQAKAEECRKRRDNASSKVRNLEHAIPIVKQVEEQRHTVENSQDTELVKTKSRLLLKLRTLLLADPADSDQLVVSRASSLAMQLRTLHTRIQELSDELSSFNESFLKPQEKRVEEAKKAGEEARELEREITMDEKKVSLLEMIRTSLRDIQPVVRRNFVAKITESANDYLKRLYGGAELENFELTEDYQFLVTRTGYKRHARRLSGGQQVLASMAFLLALSEVLSQLDFLILDEPTTHLDESRRKELVTVLENLRRVPQLVIVDHHPELLGAADSRFQVKLSHEGLSQVSLVEE